MNTKDMELLLFAAVSCAEKAGRAIMEIYDTDFDVEFKKDSSPLTIADKRSHEIISEALSRVPSSGSPIPILSEEGKDIPYEERRGWEYFWLVDPLDGTKEFVKRNGEFTINVALIHMGRPILGVVSAPVLNRIYFAAEKIGCFMAEIEKIPGEGDWAGLSGNSVRLPVKSERPFTVVASRSHMSQETKDYIDELRKAHGEINLISAGSSLKLCLLAEGRVDVYPRFAPTMEWDTAAGQAVLEQAGGSVVDHETGKPLSYNKENLLNPWFLCRV